MVMEYLKSMKQSTGTKITISSFYESAVIEKLQRDKHKRLISGEGVPL
jgi:PhoPQ-activated pathogenicity-related protein